MTKDNSRRDFIICAAALGLYAAITLVSVFFHEVWFDEAQFWVLARDLPFSDIMNQMAHEGHSALWLLMVMPFAKAGLPVIAMGLLSWVLMCAAELILLFRSPLSLPLKLALTFCAGTLYINVTVARVYSLIYLLLFLIAMLYQKRDKHPLLYGLLLGLLANTHIMMCGFVAVLGILMLIDTVKKLKADGFKKSLWQLCGLALAGLLVIALIVQLLPSLKTNCTTSETNYTPAGMIYGMLMSFSEISAQLFGKEQLFPELLLLSTVLTFLFIAALVFVGFALRKNGRLLALYIVGNFMAIVVNGGIWYANPNRSALFPLTAVFVIWLYKLLGDTNGKESRSELLKLLDKAAKPFLTWGITALVLLTVPLGVFYIVSDINGGFTPSKQTAAFIEQNIPQDAVILTSSDSFGVTSAAYLPGYQFYDVTGEKYYTFCTHTNKFEAETDFRAAVEEHFSDRDDIYIMFSSTYTDRTVDNTVFVSDLSVPYLFAVYRTTIYKYSDWAAVS